MDCGRAGWTDDFHFSPFATQRKENGRIRGSFDGNPGIREWETPTTLDLGWRLQREPVRYDRLFHVEKSIPRPRTLVDTNDSLRARALHTMVAELDLTVTNRWDERRHTTRAFHTIQWVKSLMGACVPSCRRTHRLGSSIEEARHMQCMWARLPTNRPPRKKSFESKCGQEPHSPLFCVETGLDTSQMSRAELN